VSAAETLCYATVDSPLGELLLTGHGGALRGVYMQAGRRPITVKPGWTRDPSTFAHVQTQLNEYFAGRRTTFEVVLVMDGTPFQQRVWRALQTIPYGDTTSYGELARVIGRPAAARAVGLANARNPISIIVPCHRVIGADGTLTGYGGGTERKQQLLELESRHLRALG
jgi:methylated-DNA-[protein]-cysteine S-methyltransferase